MKKAKLQGSIILSLLVAITLISNGIHAYQTTLSCANANAALGHTNDTEWRLDKNGALNTTNNTVNWTVEVLRGQTGSNTISVNGFFSISNNGSEPASVGNFVVNLQKMVESNWVSAAADVADATSGDRARSANIVARASLEDPALNARITNNYLVSGETGTFIETAASGAIELLDARRNTLWAIEPRYLIPAGSTLNLLYIAKFDNSILRIPAGAQLRAEVILTLGNISARDGACAQFIDIDGDQQIDRGEANVCSISTHHTLTLPAAERCNNVVKLSDTREDIYARNVTVGNFLTNIGGGSGVEYLATAARRSVSVQVRAGDNEGLVINRAHLSGSDTSVRVLAGRDTAGNPLYYHFPCCQGIYLRRCAPVRVPGNPVRDFETGDFCTYTQGGWGSKPNGNNPGAILQNNFAIVYPAGFVEVGIAGSGGFSMKFSSAAAIEAFLPAGGDSDALSADLTDPTSSSAGVLGGQVMALQLNVDFSARGITQGMGGPVGDLVLCNTGTSLDGSTVNQVLRAANIALGGGPLPAGLTYRSLNDLISNLNEAFDNCMPNAWAQQNLCR